MRKSSLTTAVAAALLAAGYVSAPAAMPQEASQALDATQRLEDRPLDVRFLRQSELPQAVVSTGNQPSGWRTSLTLQGRPLETLSHEGDPLVAWIPSESLESDTARAEAARIIQTGVPVLVSHRDGNPGHEARAFGVEVPGSLVLYRLLSDGRTHIATSGEMAPEDVSTATVSNVLSLTPETPRVPPHPESDVGNVDMEAPVRKFVVQQSSRYGTGASVAMDVTVARDTTKSHDRNVITVVTKVLAKPFKNGVTAMEWPLTEFFTKSPALPFRPHGTDYLLYAVGTYRLDTAIAWPSSTTPEIHAALTTPEIHPALEHKPVGSGATDHDFTDKVTTTTTYGVSVSGELGAQLGDKGISPAGKIALGFTYQRQRSEEHSVTVKLADYAIAVERHSNPQDNTQSISWTYPMNSRFANDRNYFKGGKWKVSTEKMTPMMRQADLETVSGWTVDGAYEGEITLTAGAEIENNIYQGTSPTVARTKDRPPGDVSCTVGTVAECLAERFQPLAKVKIDLGSPYLTRMPTVLLQSFAVDDGCLTQTDPVADNPVSLAPCDISEGNRKQQWTIDEEGRYVNRSSKMCLQISSTGASVAARCSLALTQKWQWRADRIHSLHNGGLSRLYVTTGGNVQAGFDPPTHQELPINPTNTLLPPWSNYPQKPIPGTFVPGFTARGEPAPEAWLHLNPVSRGERWKTVVLRTGLIR